MLGHSIIPYWQLNAGCHLIIFLHENNRLSSQMTTTTGTSLGHYADRTQRFLIQSSPISHGWFLDFSLWYSELWIHYRWPCSWLCKTHQIWSNWSITNGLCSLPVISGIPVFKITQKCVVFEIIVATAALFHHECGIILTWAGAPWLVADFGEGRTMARLQILAEIKSLAHEISQENII